MLVHAPRLTARCSHGFSATTRQRGQRYQRQGRVSIEHAQLGEVLASVRGSAGARYRVSFQVLEWGDGPLVEAACTCPHFERGFACKHLWACLADLERAPGAFALPGDGRVELVPAEGEPDEVFEEDESEHVLRRPPPARARAPEALDWLAGLAAPGVSRQGPADREVYYVVSPEDAQRLHRLEVRLLQRERTRAGGLGRLKSLAVRPSGIARSFPEPDARALSALAGCASGGLVYGASYYEMATDALRACAIPPGLQPLVVPLLASTGRLCAEPAEEPSSTETLVALRWDAEQAYAVHLEFEPAARPGDWRLVAELRGADRLLPSDLRFVLPSGLALAGDRFVRLAAPELASLVEGFRQHGATEVRGQRLPAFMARIAELPLPAIEVPDGLGWSEETGRPRPHLSIERPTARTPQTLLYARVAFDYGSGHFACGDPRAGCADVEARRIVRRDAAREAALFEELLALGFRAPPAYSRGEADVQLSRKRMPEFVRALLGRGWQVQAQGLRIRRGGLPQLRVATGVDWFDLEGHVDFEGETVPFPELLAALERGETTIALGDGSVGLVPEEWLSRLAPLAEFGRREGQALRFLPSQAMLLEALLAAPADVEADSVFRETCRQLERAGRPRARRAPGGFQGALRAYQREGLGWLHHLAELGLGGCLADDMGLGKTVQVLALLESRRGGGGAAGPPLPSLVVVPKSLVHNWLSEAARFTPQLRMLAYTGPGRSALRERFSEFDVAVTTYGTLRRDIEKLAGLRFDYVVLDEGQAVKNAASQTSKAARLLRSEHRLVLSGTPVENHLGELWALFDFLNVGMLGSSTRRIRTLADADDEAVSALARALHPFILRRTKAQVLRELPDKTEQTLLCDLEGGQKRQYEELRRHYRTALLRRVDEQGMARSRIQVLEALLRLRQAACHPGLIDPKRASESSAKLDVLLPGLEQTLDEGHKALVFSQFTSLLAIVRERLRRSGLAFEYLDGRTRNRAERIRRFQEDPDCRLFLVSLKAGGQGLNLTAADYVFLLDPWWNPAVEAQAIDRAHRIGQSRVVFAYRIVARHTIEEKILTLQESKRRLADAIVSSERGVLRQLTRDDLELLLA